MSLGAPSASVSGTVITGSVTANANGRRATLTLRDQLGNVWGQTSGTGALSLSPSNNVGNNQSRSFTATLQSDPTTPGRTLTMTSGPSNTVTTPPPPPTYIWTKTNQPAPTAGWVLVTVEGWNFRAGSNVTCTVPGVNNLSWTKTFYAADGHFGPSSQGLSADPNWIVDSDFGTCTQQ